MNSQKLGEPNLSWNISPRLLRFRLVIGLAAFFPGPLTFTRIRPDHRTHQSFMTVSETRGTKRKKPHAEARREVSNKTLISQRRLHLERQLCLNRRSYCISLRLPCQPRSDCLLEILGSLLPCWPGRSWLRFLIAHSMRDLADGIRRYAIRRPCF